MYTSIIFAKLLGPYCLIVSAGVLINFKTYQTMLGDFTRNTGLVYLAGIFSLIFGLLIVVFHNVWVMDWPAAITIMGWMGIGKGIRLIWFPNSIAQAVEFYEKKQNLMIVRLVAVMLIGLALTSFGYFSI